MGRVGSGSFSRSLVCLAGAAALPAVVAAGASAASAGVASQVISYTSGSFPNNPFLTPYQVSSSALGEPAGDTGFGAATPFNPPFSTSHIVLVYPGGGITLKMSEVVPVTNALTLGVFANNGLIDVSEGGTGVAGNPASTFSPVPRAVVSVSADNLSWVTLDANPGTGAADPFVFDVPTNFYTDTSISGYFAPLGTQEADVYKPFAGNLADFDGLNYAQMLALLDGSAGGTWLDLSSSGLGGVEYVRFEVPSDATYRFALDAVTSVAALPEPAGALAVTALALGLATTRRRRSS